MLTFDDPLRPLSPADLRSSSVPAGTALVCAEPARQAGAEPVAGALVRRGWADPDIGD